MIQIVKNPPTIQEDLGSIPRSGISWRRKCQPIPEFLPWRIHEQRSLAGYGPQGRQESDVNELLALSRFSHSANVYPCRTIITLVKLLEMNYLFAIYTSRMSNYVYTITSNRKKMISTFSIVKKISPIMQSILII